MALTVEQQVARILDYTNLKLIGWYREVKHSYDVDGIGVASYNPDTKIITINFSENGKNYIHTNEFWQFEQIDYVYNVWMESELIEVKN